MGVQAVLIAAAARSCCSATAVMVNTAPFSHRGVSNSPGWSAPPESCRSHTSSLGGVGSPDSTPRLISGRGQVVRTRLSSQVTDGWLVSFLVSFMFVYLRPSPSTTAL